MLESFHHEDRERAHAMFIYYRLICFTLMKENLYWEKERFFLAFFDVFRCCGLLLLASYPPLTFFFLLFKLAFLLFFSLVFIMMVCYFYIFQRFNLQLFFASHTHFTFYKLSLPLSKDMKKKGSIFSVSFHLLVLFLLL